MLDQWDSILNSNEFKTYTPQERAIIKAQFFKENIADTPEFQSFDDSEKQKIIGNFDSYDPEDYIPSRTFLGTLGDIGISAAKGVIGLGETAVGLADIPTGGFVGKAMQDYIGYDPKQAKGVLESYYSPAQKAANLKVQNAQGILGTTKAMLQNPSTIINAAVESAPSMVAGGAAGKLIGGAAKLAPFVSGAIGEGIVTAGQQAEQIRQESKSGYLSTGQAGAAVVSGAITGAIGLAGGRIAKKLGFGDIDTMLAGGKLEATQQGIFKRIVGGGISEGVFEELPQSIQEQVWVNAALDRPLTEGVSEAAASGMLVGFAMGGGANAISTASNVDEAVSAFNNATKPEQGPLEIKTAEGKILTRQNILNALVTGGMTPDEVAALKQNNPGAANEIDSAIKDFQEGRANAPIISFEKHTDEERKAMQAEIERQRKEAPKVQQAIKEREQNVALQAEIQKARELRQAEIKKRDALGQDFTGFKEELGRSMEKRNAEERRMRSVNAEIERNRVARQELERQAKERRVEPPVDQAAEEAIVSNREAVKRINTLHDMWDSLSKDDQDKAQVELSRLSTQLDQIDQIERDRVIKEASRDFSRSNKEQRMIEARRKLKEADRLGLVLESRDEIERAAYPQVQREPEVEYTKTGVWEEPNAEESGAQTGETGGTEGTDRGPEERLRVRDDAEEGAPGEAPQKEQIDQAAHEAATSTENNLPEPTDAQKAAGNYKMGHTSIDGLDITIENPEGSTRQEARPADAGDDWEPSWKTKMVGHYGYFKRSEGKDGDHVDVFVGGNPDSQKAYIIDQRDLKNGGFDEHKVVMGVDSEQAAKDLYLSNYEKGWDGIGAISEVNTQDLKSWLDQGKQNKPYGDFKPLAQEPTAPVPPPAEPAPSQAPPTQTPSLEDMNSGKALVDGLKSKINKWISNATNEGARPLDTKWERGAVKRFRDTEMAGLMKGWQYGKWAAARIAAGKAETFGDLIKALDKISTQVETKPQTKREKSIQEYKSYVESLTDEQRQQAGGLVVDEPDSPGMQVIKIKKALTAAQSVTTVKSEPKPKEAPDGTVLQPSERLPQAEPSGGIQETGEVGGTERVPEPEIQGSPGGQGVNAPVGDERPGGRGTDVEGPSSPADVDYSITPDDRLGEGGAKSKFKDNIAAIRIIKELGDKPASAEQQAALVKYVGWGGMPQAFERPDGTVSSGWEKEAAEIKGLLTESEYAAARRSTQDAHYTSKPVIDSIYDAIQRIGFKKGKILEPAVGTGNFIGLMPKSIRKGSRITGIELDPLTAAIASKLYPKQTIVNSGFQDVTIAPESYDLAIGNPPFGEQKLFDPENKDLKRFSIHNYFFAKSIKGLRPNGILAMVVSSHMMDKQGGEQRAWISKHAELLGAIRLPGNAFKATAGTEVTTDIVFLRKRALGEIPRSDEPAWQATKEVQGKDSRYRVNEYFASHPDMMLGELVPNKLFPGEVVNGVYNGAPGLAARGEWSKNLLRQAVEKLPSNIYQEGQTFEQVQNSGIVVSDPGFARPYGYTIDDNGNAVRRLPDVNGEPVYEPVEYAGEPISGTRLGRFKGLMRLRDDIRQLIRAELSDDPMMEKYRKKLNSDYDAFVYNFGRINENSNSSVLKDDPTDLPLLRSLELNFDPGVSATVAKKKGTKPSKPSADKAAIFSVRTREPYRSASSAKDSKHGLAISLRERGVVDIDQISKLTGKKRDQVISELKGLIFRNPESGKWETSDSYLSGNVKRKLRLAEQAAEDDPAYNDNVEYLKEVQPEDVPPDFISFRVGATWMPIEIYRKFAEDVLKAPMDINYLDSVGVWSVKTHRGVASSFDTDRMSAGDIYEKMLKSSDIAVYDVDRDGKRTLNRDATTIARSKADEIDRAFKDWVLSDSTLRDQMARQFNDVVNTTIDSKFDGSHMIFPGMGIIDSSKKRDDQLRTHQKSYAWRMIQKGKGLADHVVGSGKTFASIAAGIEMKRMGLLKKPMYVVPNHLVEQWSTDFQKLYPGANILTVTKNDFQKKNRLQFMAKIATGDWDAVVIAHSSFGFIPMPLDYETKFYRDQLQQYEQAITELQAAEGKKSRSVKQMEKAKEKLEQKLKDLADKPRDDVVDFSELGVDGLFVDEAHEFKNLFYATSRTRVAGLGNPQGSKKAFDLFVKTRYLLDHNDDRGVFFLTGTPVSNSISEMYTMMRYLEYDRMQEMGIKHFDQWSNMFASAVTDWEVDPTGTRYRLQTKLDFVNLPGLISFYKDFADIITTDDLKQDAKKQGKIWPIPDVKGGKPQNVVVDRSDLQKGFMAWIVKRFDSMPSDPKEDNPLKATGEAMKASLDIRLIDPSLPDHPGSKVNESVRRTVEIYKKWNSRKGAQLVFCDLSVPKKSRGQHVSEIRELKAKIQNLEQRLEDEAFSDNIGEIENEYNRLVARYEKYSPAELMAADSDFSVYDDFKSKLIANGIPENEVAFIHDANTDQQKAKLFDEVRNGRVRVLIGSTSKMGAGMNVQKRLVALHHLDAPWRPSDLEQREGRIIRQGNDFFDESIKTGKPFEVEIYRYATKETLDTRRWQIIERKAKTIEQLRTGDHAWGDKIEDTVGEAANAAEMKAAASGNPLILKEIQLRKELDELESKKRADRSQRFSYKKKIDDAETFESNYQDILSDLKKDYDRVSANPKDHTPEGWSISLDGKTFKSKDTTEKGLKEIRDKFRNAAISVIGPLFDESVRKPDEVEIKYRGVTYSIDRYKKIVRFIPDFAATDQYNHIGRGFQISMGDKFSPDGLLVRLDNSIDMVGEGYESATQWVNERRDKLNQAADIARKELGKTKDYDEDIKRIADEHRNVLQRLQSQDQTENREEPDFSMWEGGDQGIQGRIRESERGMQRSLAKLESEPVPEQDDGKEKFYIVTPQKELVHIEHAKTVKIVDWLETFAYKGESGNWTISEKSTGARLSGGMTRKDAVAHAEIALNKYGKEKTFELMKDLPRVNDLLNTLKNSDGSPQLSIDTTNAGMVSEITSSDIFKAFGNSEKITLRFIDGEVNGYRTKLPNGSIVFIVKDKEEIIYDIDSIAEKWGIPKFKLRRYKEKGILTVKGKYRTLEEKIGFIELSKKADPGTLSHEKFHALFSMVFTENERYKILNRYKTEERAAEAFRRQEGFTRSFWEKIKAFIERIRNIISGDVFNPSYGETRTIFDEEKGEIGLGINADKKKVVNFKESLEPITDQDYIENRASRKNIKLYAEGNISRVRSEFAEMADKFLGSISTRLGNVSEKLKSKLRKMDYDIMTASAQDVEAVMPLLKKAKTKMSKDDFADWDYARKNSDTAKINELIEKYDLRKEYDAYRKVLDGIRKDALDVGLGIGEIEEYAPRVLKDSRGFLKAMGNPSGEWAIYTRRLRERAAELEISVDEMTPDMRAGIISNMILTGHTGLGSPPATKARKLRKIPASLNRFYMDSDGALVAHIHSMRKNIEARRFFGKIPEKVSEIRQRLHSVQAKLRDVNNQLKDQTIDDEKRDKLEKRRNRYFGLTQQYWDYLEKYALQRDYRQNIGSYVDSLIINHEIEGKDERIVNEILNARFHERGTYGIWQTYKNLSYIDTMGSPLSALTQIGDLAWAAYEGGLIRALKYAGKSLVGKSKITKEQIGIERIAQEFADSGTLSKAVSKVFKWVQLERMDAIGKESLLNAAFDKYQKQAKTNPEKLKAKLFKTFEEQTDQLIEDLAAGNVTDNVKLLLYNRLLDFQPVALSEMPEKYLNAGNGRIFYMLKTFTLKQFDIFRNEVYNKIKNGTPAEKVEGFKNLVRLSMFFVLANAGADMLKDWVLGRDTDFQDMAVDNMLRLFGVSKYITWQARTEGVGTALAKQILPPFKFIDSLGKDIASAGDGKGLEVIGSVPAIGKLAYWHMGRGTTKRQDLWDIRWRRRKRELSDIKQRLDESDSPREFMAKHGIELAELNKINQAQGQLNLWTKRINQLKKMGETAQRKTLIEKLRQRRIDLIRAMLNEK